MKPVRTVTFAVLVLADLSLVLLVPFIAPAPKPPMPKITITAPANALKQGSGPPPAEIQCDGDDVRTPWCEARYTNVI